MLRRQKGFTIVELLIVIVIIGILAAITVVSYTGIARQASDSIVKSDASNLASSLGLYAATHTDQYVSWFSGDAIPAGANFKVSADNYADITTSSNLQKYCIRVFNTKSSYTSAETAYTAEQPAGACSELDASDAAVAVTAPQSGWLALGDHCGIRYDGKGYCWGDNYYGWLGNGNNNNSATTTAVYMSGALAGKTLKSISGSCAIASDNNAYCWGYNREGNLGIGTSGSGTDSNVPVAVSTAGVLAGKTIKKISSSGSSTCVIASDDNAYCWGNNSSGKLGDGTMTNSAYPIAVDTSGALAGKTIKDISVGAYQTCAIASDDNAYCWGDDNYGTLGQNGTNFSSVPVAVNRSGALAGKTIKNIIVNGLRTACVIASDNNVYCWGLNSYGAVGDGTNTTRRVPAQVINTGALAGKTVKHIAGASSGAVCAIASDNKAYCWGNNNMGGLGNGTVGGSSNIPVSVQMSGMIGNRNLKALSGGASAVCAIATDNTGYCWGSMGGYRGAFGDNSMYGDDGYGNYYANVPVLVPQP